MKIADRRAPWSAHHKLDDAPHLCDRDRFRERPDWKGAWIRALVTGKIPAGITMFTA
jgi:hypothetical protein